MDSSSVEHVSERQKRRYVDFITDSSTHSTHNHISELSHRDITNNHSDGRASVWEGLESYAAESTQPTAAMSASPAVMSSANVSKRRGTACDACRSKKTRCDAARPVCSNCVKAQTDCNYSGGSGQMSVYESTSLQILEGISRIEEALKVQTTHSHETVTSPLSQATSVYQLMSPLPVPQMSIENSMSDFSWQDQNDALQLKTDIQGNLDSILSWPTYNNCPKAIAPIQNATPPMLQMPSMTENDVQVLVKYYVDNIYPRTPIVDLQHLERAVRNFAENGPQWDLPSCLVMLACALGAISRVIPVRLAQVSFETTHIMERHRDQAYKWWSLAQKRLGLATSETSMIGIQCQCLAGLWHMYVLEPVPALKNYNAACLSWQSTFLLSKIDDFDDTNERQQYCKQRIFWTCLKAESELRAELSLPLSDAGRQEFPHDMPTPNMNSLMSNGRGQDEQARDWYYYLGEMFLRRCFNRITHEVITFSKFNVKRVASVQNFVTVASEFESTLENWRASLPRSIFFEESTSLADGSDYDDMQHFLRVRLLECKDRLYQPFVKLALYAQEDEPGLPIVFDFARKGLQCCVDRVHSGLVEFRTHRTWFECRAVLCSALVLFAAREICARESMHDILPLGWQEALLKIRLILDTWSSDSLEIQKYKELYHWAENASKRPI